MKKILITLIACSVLSGCASIVKGKYKNINIMTATGETAEVNVVSASGVQTLMIPTVTTIRRDNQDITITVKEDSCNNSSTSIVSSKIEPWFLGNLVSGGLFGSSTDALTGAMWTYDDNVAVPVYKKSVCQK